MMDESESNDCFNVVIPQDAVEVKVTSIINPHFMRICEASDDRKTKNDLFRMLQKVLKHKKKRGFEKNYIPERGDNVLVSVNLMTDLKIDLPDWICRGVVIDSSTKSSDIFLLDYGITINVPAESVIKYSKNSIPIDPLTFTVGIYNILPTDSKFCILKEWPKETINFVRELIQSSKKIFFQILDCDRKTNRKYGELFLVLGDKNISLSKVLIYRHSAVSLFNELLQAIKSNVEGESLVPYHIGPQKPMVNGDTSAELNDSILLNKKKFIDYKKKQINDKILIRSKFSCQPLEHVEDSRFTALIHKALKNQGVRTPKQIQSYMWPAIKQGLNVAVISSKNSGKTIGYTVPILSSIAANEEIITKSQKKSNVTKPIALILSGSIIKCIDIATKCKNILFYHQDIKSFAAFNGLTDRQIMTNILNKFHILVSTPPFLLRLLEKYSSKLNFSELTHLVIDSADVLLDKYFSELSSLIKKYKIINNQPENSLERGSVQIVLSSKSWTEKVRSFVEVVMKEDTYICIGSFTEAAAFCRVKGRMLIRHTEKKKYEVLGMLEDYKIVKTMIICVDSEEALELNDFLVSKSIQTLLAHEKIVVTEIHEVRNVWAKCLPGVYPVIICTDQILSELEISNIEFLIHYSITNTSKTQFNRRFSVLMDNWTEEELKTKCKVSILFDETKENAHFKGVVDILKRLKVELPEDWSEMADGFDLANNLKKKNYPICDYVKSFGVCQDNSCPYRHRIIAEVDGPITDITIGDELKLHVTYIQSASHFTARVLERTRKCKETGKDVTDILPYEILKLNMKMKQHYSELKNKRTITEVFIGSFYALRNSENTFSRIKVLNIVERNKRTDKPRVVRVQCIDDGRVFDRVYVHELYEISEELLQFKFPLVNIFLTGIAPFDEERDWTEIASESVHDWFIKNCNGTSSFVYAKVLLHIGDSIWTDTLVVRSKLIGYSDLVSASLQDVIKKQEHGIENKKHLSNLVNLCHSGGLMEVNGNPISISQRENELKSSIDECD